MAFTTFRSFMGIALGAIALVMLISPLFGVKFQPWFAAMLDQLEDWELELFFQFVTPIVRSMIEGLNATFGWKLNLADWWHHAFVLLWLLHGSIARNFGQGRGWDYFFFVFVVGGLTALAGGAAVGSTPQDSWEVLIFGLYAILAFILSEGLWTLVRQGWRRFLFGMPRQERSSSGEHVRSWAVVVFMSLFIVLHAILFFVRNDVIRSEYQSLAVPLDVMSPGLVALLAIVGAVGVASLTFSLLRHSLAPQRGLEGDPHFGLGADIVGTMGLAAFLAAVGVFLAG